MLQKPPATGLWEGRDLVLKAGADASLCLWGRGHTHQCELIKPLSKGLGSSHLLSPLLSQDMGLLGFTVLLSPCLEEKLPCPKNLSGSGHLHIMS